MDGTADAGAIWEEHNAGLRRFVERRVSDSSAVDDILQDVFLKIHSRIDTLNDDARLEAWIFRIARNAVIDHYRARKPHLPLSADLEEPPAEERSALENLADCVGPMIERLPDRYRESVILSELEGVNQAEIARRQDLSLSAVKSRVRRGRAKLKEMISECCRLEFDRLGTLVGFDPKTAGCRPC
jgi:RNA polymerase sigma-70 factor (ECF subfamily)